MQLNKVLKGVLIALPMVTLVACSSSPSDKQAEAERNSASSSASTSTSTGSDVQVDRADPIKSAQELKEKQLKKLMNNQTVYFDFDRSNLRTEFNSLVEEHADFLVKNPSQRVVIEGHCDKRGTPEYNIALGERRAKAVEVYLLNSGVSASQISVVSYGEEKPAVMGDTEAAFSKNRRAVLVYQ
ncbi:peptidoglycan-associated lipoprotein Pal [Paraneptunicella aestuarii]|uniref:peptidoglycan-associated lipoprotein Pal n=1 Tax=Paraneptunicella aestuarii TaxID=2831148 RepID=UPI001E511AC8|nr:peptidoglycan-associated lipoprotein Pal [Paraneptunicella aestuarii]UAA37319.1 peptidoglycan-associated lipoprotein Pal [Paraneptunicella aestuarii]